MRITIDSKGCTTNSCTTPGAENALATLIGDINSLGGDMRKALSTGVYQAALRPLPNGTLGYAMQYCGHSPCYTVTTSNNPLWVAYVYPTGDTTLVFEDAAYVFINQA